MKELTDKYKLLLKKFKTRENGPAVESMNRMGLKYHRNFGIALAELKSFANNPEFTNDPEFALSLWQKSSREAKILSLMMVDPEKLSKEQIDDYVSGINNVELAEQAALNLLCKIPNHLIYALDWCKGEETYTKLTGLLVLSRIAMVDKDISDTEFEKFINILPKVAEENNFHIKRGLSRALLQIAKRNDKLKQTVLKFTKQVNSYNKDMASWLHEEVDYYLIENKKTD